MTDFPREPHLEEDEEPSEDELAAAAELARALDREVLSAALHDELLPALEAAHVLRAAHAPDLSAQRLDALFETLEAALPAAPLDARPGVWSRPGLRALLALLSGAGAAAALALWLSARTPDAADAAARLPPPSVELLAAQTEAVARRSTDAASDVTSEGRGERPAPGAASAPELDRAMRPYRAELLAQLEAEYTP
jgi:hypothetical protein